MINFCYQQVWSALERKQFLKAAQLYLFSHHIVSILHIDTGDTSAPKLLVGLVFFKALYNIVLLNNVLDYVIYDCFHTSTYSTIIICQRETEHYFVK